MQQNAPARYVDKPHATSDETDNRPTCSKFMTHQIGHNQILASSKREVNNGLVTRNEYCNQ
jgi:hypothetical protein